MTSEIELAVSCCLMALIWVIQIVHYPSFRFISEQRFPEFERFHTQRISFLVIPLMLLELASTTMSLLNNLNFVNITSMVLVLTVWVSTFSLSVPCHRTLNHGKNDEVIEKLILTNWIRTVAWTAKCVLLLVARQS